ncbi:CAP domain-containing protein [Ammoniphilus sp. 3BR4]|uniref:CAP domain-containing protein n=1 Tax=Ammoniphilus sp. 3BR4 TaxID=3158265 RepID=UPI0034657958
MKLKRLIIPTLLLSLAISGCGLNSQGALPAEKPPVNVQNTGKSAVRIQNAQYPSGGNAGQANQWQWQIIPLQPNQQQTIPWQPAPGQGRETPPPHPAQQQPAQNNAPNTAVTLSNDEQQMLNLVNQERQQNGLSPLKANPELTRLARTKSQDMINGNYFSHQSPTYGSPFDMIRNAGVSFTTAGENIAGNQTVEGAHRALMNSPGHRANILSNQYDQVGIGIVPGGPYGNMFTQMFIK